MRLLLAILVTLLSTSALCQQIKDIKDKPAEDTPHTRLGPGHGGGAGGPGETRLFGSLLNLGANLLGGFAHQINQGNRRPVGGNFHGTHGRPSGGIHHRPQRPGVITHSHSPFGLHSHGPGDSHGHGSSHSHGNSHGQGSGFNNHGSQSLGGLFGFGNRPGFGGHSNRPGFGGHSNRPGFGGHSNRPGFGGHSNRPGFSGHGNRPGFSEHGDRPGFGGHGSFGQGHNHGSGNSGQSHGSGSFGQSHGSGSFGHGQNQGGGSFGQGHNQGGGNFGQGHNQGGGSFGQGHNQGGGSFGQSHGGGNFGHGHQQGGGSFGQSPGSGNFGHNQNGGSSGHGGHSSSGFGGHGHSGGILDDHHSSSGHGGNSGHSGNSGHGENSGHGGNSGHGVNSGLPTGVIIEPGGTGIDVSKNPALESHLSNIFNQAIQTKPGSCPDKPRRCRNNRNQKICRQDQECNGSRKCCFDSCVINTICKQPIFSDGGSSGTHGNGGHHVESTTVPFLDLIDLRIQPSSAGGSTGGGQKPRKGNKEKDITADGAPHAIAFS